VRVEPADQLDAAEIDERPDDRAATRRNTGHGMSGIGR
jgi:hypothetical protein